MTLPEQLLDVLKQMYEKGLVVTVEQVSLPPLAMGHYYTRVRARPARDSTGPMIFHMDLDNPQPPTEHTA